MYIFNTMAEYEKTKTKFHLNKSVPGAGIIRNAGIIQGRVLYEEIQYVLFQQRKKNAMSFPT